MIFRGIWPSIYTSNLIENNNRGGLKHQMTEEQFPEDILERFCMQLHVDTTVKTVSKAHEIPGRYASTTGNV